MSLEIDWGSDATGTGASGAQPVRSAPSTTSASSGAAPVRHRDDQQEPDFGVELYADIAGLLAGGLPAPPKPALGKRSDGNYLFYARQVNLVFGDPESGKTWVALATAVEVLKERGKVLVLDLDHNGAPATVGRLLALGAPEDVLADPDMFRYCEPEDALHVIAVAEDAREWCPAVAVVDSLGELLPTFGKNSNSADEFTYVHTRVLKPLARSGAAVLLIDHLAKNSDSRSHGPGGTMAKRRAMGGVSLRVTVKDQFAPGKGGSAYLSINKDRPGGLREHSGTRGREPFAGTFRLLAFNDAILEAEIVAPDDAEDIPNFLTAGPANDQADADSAQLAALDPPPKSRRDVEVRMGWGSHRAGAALRSYRDDHD